MGHLIRDVCSSAAVLPTTGADPTRIVITAIGLLLAGVALVTWGRRMRRSLSAVAVVLGCLSLLHASPPRVEAACDPAVSATAVAATTTTSSSTTTTTLAESSPPVVSTTIGTVLSESSSSTSSSSTSTTSSTTTSTTTTVAPPNVVPDVPVPALAGASFLVVLLGARGLLARDLPRRRRSM